jgi:rhodanese-related sulfurtransferase
MQTSTSAPSSGAVTAIDAIALRQLLESETVSLVDVREAGEHARERIVGSQLHPLSRFDAETVGNLPEPIVLYCESGNRTIQAAKQIGAIGDRRVYHLRDGIAGWKQAGYRTEIDTRAPLPMMRQVQIVAGSLVLTGTLLAALVSPWFLLLTGFVGSGLIFAGVTGFCGMAKLLAILPYNRV